MPFDNENKQDEIVRALADDYCRYSPRSARYHEKALSYLVDGGSHSIRLYQPFSPQIVNSQGSQVIDSDNHRVLDFWQGHHANILGHNPPLIIQALLELYKSKKGLQTGFCDCSQADVAQIICRQTNHDRVRFTTSGTLATMYAIFLSKAYTKRDLVLKVGGGWHGGHPWGLVGIDYHRENARGYQGIDSAGIPSSMAKEVVLTRFNDPEALRECFQKHGDKIACFILEPVVGSGGFIPASQEYMITARKLTHNYGTLLILDEVIAGFRFQASDAGSLYGIRPDISTFGKIIGGGMPVSAVAGRADIMELASTNMHSSNRVKFSGGTFSGHPACFVAARECLEYLIQNQDTVYSRLTQISRGMRQMLKSVFSEEGILAHATGCGHSVVTDSSLAMLIFPYSEKTQFVSPEDVWDSEKSNVVLREKIWKLALLLENVHVFHGFGSISFAHDEEDISRMENAIRKAIGRIKKIAHCWPGETR
jgi:glutamate-1-semialdehyde 2,1-aminomutase